MRFALPALALGLLGCTAGPTWADRAARADEASLWSATITALLVVPGNIDPLATPEAMAHAAAAAATDPFDPNECVTATVDGPTVTYQLDHCAGSFALVHATGRLVVTYAPPAAGHTIFHAAATDLELNGELVTFEADASVLNDGRGTRTIDTTYEARGTGQRGTAITLSSHQIARWMDTWGCLLVDQTTDDFFLENESWAGTSTGITMCVGECPMSGGQLTWTRDVTLALSYGGSRTVGWTVQNGASASGTLTITCGP